ncbi:SpvB/TcaC N-terminal domain-containing protein [Yersinia similis]|uniref:Insecticidal toxin complex protein n=1 Tax=Yersinia similis TaxID=367190 RepID=A0A0T9Q8B2_9GAMM|nr:SpvB/TcaC N-terminal domain-containing protein [Yersinia similis]CNF90348.1 insecticidal toxin complex protein [Yersinia similis]CNI00667.1 insecticidal toxin complex protein [Yersinia similis]
MENSKQQVAVAPLSLPKGGGAITGMGDSLGAIGPSGMATLTLPLPISAGRGYAPPLALNYSSGNGNGPFGLGWQLNTMAICRRTSKRVPHYDEHDEFLAPSGEVLVVAIDQQGNIERTEQSLKGEQFSVIRYLPRIEGSFNRIEYWQPRVDNSQAPFWVVHGSDGQKHCLGYSASARIADPQHPEHIAEWLLEESVSLSGEHICYLYQAEDEQGIDEDEKQNHPAASAQRYLSTVVYGNREVAHELYCLTQQPTEKSWLFSLIFDHGEYSNIADQVPIAEEGKSWTYRQDAFSHFNYGFEIRTRRLCQQVLMYHNLSALAGNEPDQQPTLVSRLRLNYQHDVYATQLVGCQRLAHEPKGKTCSLPPLEFDYQTFPDNNEKPYWRQRLEEINPTESDDQDLSANWQPLEDWAEFNHQYQMVDLNGEGIPGMLYQDRGHWCYRPPARQPGTLNGITFGPAQSLPTLPAMGENATLMDINGDGKLDWVISQPGLAGYFSRDPDQSWTQFTPLSALPAEYFHPQAQLADLIGSGLSDLALIGPKSVRLYVNQRDGFATATQVAQEGNITLPLPGAHYSELVAFSDLIGSGQQHLVRVRHDSVTCWPNRGHGRFGNPISLPGFNQPIEQFNPLAVHLADIDGSGTIDLIYATAHQLLIYRNQSGNRFAKPVEVTLPAGIRFDNSCQLSLADIQGLGVASIILSVPHPAPQHWRYDFVASKPYLLCTTNNNMGAESQLSYRSSVQFWLDEKALAAKQGYQPVCHLPFPIHLLAQTTQLDEITGNSLTQKASYYHGFYDGIQREFCGFGRVDTLDTDTSAQGSAQERTSPTKTCQWFHTGQPDNEQLWLHEYWQGDSQAYGLPPSRLTKFTEEIQGDGTLSDVNDNQAYWLHRALKGSLLRSELYGLDDSELATQPYSVNNSRYQVRQIQSSTDEITSPVALPMMLEQLNYHYERIVQDPQCSQQIVLRCDEFGHPLHSATIHYPRRDKASITPYSWLANEHWNSHFDEQQQQLRITESQQSYHHEISDKFYVLGLPAGQRSDVLTYPDNFVPTEGINWEELQQPEGLLGTKAERTFAGQQEVFYTSDTIPGLNAYSQYAEFDDQALSALDELLPVEGRGQHLIDAGYQSVPRLFARPGETDIWVAQRGFTDYGDASRFYRPISQRSSLLVGKTALEWDKNSCAITKMILADGSTTQAEYDYRFITPYQLTDINDNSRHIELDALGRVTSSRFWGTELNSQTGEISTTGFPLIAEHPFTVPNSVDDAISMENTRVPVAQFSVYQPQSWMISLQLDDIEILSETNNVTLEYLFQNHILIDNYYLCPLALRRWIRQSNPRIAENVGLALENPVRHPPHVLTVTVDNYFSASEPQQHQQTLAFSDGFGRVLQSAQRVEAGTAYLHTGEGGLVADQQGHLTQDESDQRWAVSGRTEYDNKGLPIRRYQPYFLDGWHYIADDNARKESWANTHIYDPLGREIKVITAKGYLRRAHYFPWCVISEDENDTASEITPNP